VNFVFIEIRWRVLWLEIPENNAECEARTDRGESNNHGEQLLKPADCDLTFTRRHCTRVAKGLWTMNEAATGGVG